MVLPAPAADAGLAQAWAPLGVVARLLERSSQGTLVLLRGAEVTQLGSVVRALSPSPPWSADPEVLRVCLSGTELLNAPAGSRVLLRVRPQEVDWLNLIRPQFAQQRLRAVLWVDEEAMERLRHHAVDLLDWVSRTLVVPPRRWPVFAEQGVRAAMNAGVPFAWDGERHELDALLGDVGWEDGTVTLRAAMSVWELLRALERPGLPVVEGMERDVDPWRVRIALARAGREGAWVALRPAKPPAGMWRLHARQEDWAKATAELRDAGWEHAGTMAAWVDLEPERIEEALARVGQAPLDPVAYAPGRVAVGDGPAHVLRARIGDEDVQAARAGLRDGEAPDDAATRALWSEGSELWNNDVRGSTEARLVRCIRGLGEEIPAAGSVEAAVEVGLTDVAAELGRIRFEHGVEPRADRVVEWLHEYGETEEALRIAGVWIERARSADDQGGLGPALSWLGDLEVAQGNGEQARRYYEDSLAIFQQLVEREPGRSDLQRDLSVSYNKLGDLHGALGKGEQARRYYEDSLAIARKLVEREPGRSDLLGDLALSYERIAHVVPDEADQWLGKAIDLHRDRLARDPDNATIQRELAVVLTALAQVPRLQDDPARRAALRREALALLQQLRAHGALDARYQPTLDGLANAEG